MIAVHCDYGRVLIVDVLDPALVYGNEAMRCTGRQAESGEERGREEREEEDRDKRRRRTGRGSRRKTTEEEDEGEEEKESEQNKRNGILMPTRMPTNRFRQTKSGRSTPTGSVETVYVHSCAIYPSCVISIPCSQQMVRLV